MAGTNAKNAWDSVLGKSSAKSRSAKRAESEAQKKKLWDDLQKSNSISTTRYADSSEIDWLFDEEADRFHQSYSGQANAGAAYNAGKNTQRAMSSIYDRNAGGSIRSSGVIPATQAANSKAQLAQKQLEEGRYYIPDDSYAAWQAIAGAAYANTDASAQNTLKARSGDASVLTDQRSAIDQLRKDGQHDNWWNRLWGTHSYTNQEEIDAAEKEYQRNVDLLKLYGTETIRNRKPQTSMIDYTEDDYYADLNTILHKAQGIDIPQGDYLEAAKRLRGFVGNTAVEQEAFADPSGQWMDKYRGLYGQRMNTLDRYIDKYSGAAGTEYDFSAEDYTTYQRAYDRYIERKAADEQALSAAAQKVQDKWGGLENRPDFATYSTHVPTKGGYYDEYDVLNWRAQVNDMVALGANPERFEDAASILSLDPVNDSDAYPYLEYGLQYMTDQDRSRFFYLYNNPEYGPDAALEYLEDIGYRTMRANTEAYQDATAQGADDSALTSAALSVAAPFYGLMNSVASLNTLYDKATGREVNPYDPTFLYGTMRDAVVGEVGSNIAEATAGAPRLFGQNIFQMGYNAVMSAAESALNVGAFGSTGTVAMGMGAFNSSYQQGLAAGKSDMDAFIDALVDGAIETGTEYFSVEAFLSDPTSPMGYFLKNMFTEGAEEGTGTILRAGYDQLKNGIDSTINTRIDELRVMGYSPTEAKRTALKEWLNELAGDMTTGALSGGVMSGPVAVQSSIENRSTGKALQENAGETGYQSLIDLAGTVELSKSGQKILDELRGLAAQRQVVPETEVTQKEGIEYPGQQAQEQVVPETEVAQKEAVEYPGQQAQEQVVTEAEVAQKEAVEYPGQQTVSKPGVSKSKLGQLYREVAQKLDEKARDVLREFMSFDLAKELRQRGLPAQEAKDLAGSVLRIQDGSFTEADVQAVSGSTEARGVLSAWTALADKVDRAKGALGELAGMLQKKDSANAETETGEESTSIEATQPEDEFDVQAAEVQAEAENLLSSGGEASTLDGEEIEVLGVEPAGSAESGETPKLRIRTADGTERSVAADSVAYGAKDAGVYQLAAYAGSYGRNADQMFNLRQSGQDVDDYARAFSKAAQTGSDGRNLSLLVSSGAVDVLTPGQAQAAYDIGRSLRAQRSQTQQEALNAKGANVQVGSLDVSQINMASLNKQQRASVDAMGKLAKALGINVRFVKSVADESGRYTTENGSYDPNSRTLTLDIHAGSNYASDTNYAVMNTAGHELTHYIRQFADSALWDGYQDFVMDHLDSKIDLEREIQKRMAQNEKLDRDGAIEEIVADASGEALSRLTEAQIQEMAQENPTLMQKIARFMKKWIGNLKKQIEIAFKGTEAKTEAARQMQDALDEMAEMWNGLLVEAGRNANQTAAKVNQTTQKANQTAAKVGQTTQKANQTAQTRTEAAQESEKLFIPYAHIDERDIFSVKEEQTELFCSEVEEARFAYAAAAGVLLDDLNVSVPGQKIYIRDSQGALSVTGQNRTTSDLLARMKDETGWTWDEIRQALTAFADMGRADNDYPLVKNTIRNRRVEVYLHEMLTRGYKTLDGTQLAPWREYAEAMAAYQGSKGAGLDVQIPKGAIPFEEYAFADEFADDGDVKFSVRTLSDGTQYTLVDATEIEADGITDADSIGKKARIYMRQKYKGVVLPVGATKSAYIRRDGINEYTNPRKFLSNEDYSSKMVAATELENLLQASSYLRWAKDDGHHPEAVRGWTYWRTVFAVKDADSEALKVFQGDVQIMRIARGDVFHDITRIKEITNDTIGQSIVMDAKFVGDGGSIAQPDDSVKFSLRPTDTPQFRRWFKGSKVVNDDGSPKILYHQTNADFTEFDVGRQGAGYSDSEMPSGVYMKEFPDTIKLGADYKSSIQMALYASIQSPLVFEDRAAAKRHWEKNVPGYAELSRELDELNAHYGAEYDRQEALWFDADDAVSERAMEESDRILAEWTEAENTKRREMHMALDSYFADGGFDGIILEADQGTGGTVKTYVAFKGTQVKSATDNIGTFDPMNPDIRFQQRDPDQISDRELLATALQNVTQNADEWDNLRRYQKKIAALNEKQRMLEQTDARIAELKGKSDRASRDELIRMQNNARTLARSIERADGELLKYEAMKPIKKLAERQREDYRQKLKARTDERMRKYKERMKQDMQDRIREVRAREAERGKQRLDKAVEHAREVGNRRVDRLKESEAKAKYRERIQKDVSTLREWLTQPTNKGHVPQFLRAPLADFLESLDFTSARALRGGDATKADQKMLEKMNALRRALANTREQQAAGMDSETAFRDYLDLPQGFVSEFDAAIADIEATLNQGGTDIPVNRMTAEQLKTLSNMIRTINTAVRKANSFLANRRYQTVSGAAQDSIRTLSRLGAKSARNAILEKAGGFLDWTNATPYYVFKRFGDGGKAVFEGLMDGWDRLAFNSRRLIDYANSCYTTEQVRAWSQELHEIKLGGATVKMTTAQIMSLYCLNKRAQARGHLLGGGMRIADIVTKGKTITQADNHILGAQDIVSITKLLTAEQRAVADKMQEFMNTVCTDWGNEVSMQRFGYKAFGDEANYFPIETDSNNRKAIDEQAQENSLFRLLNLSATKSTIKNANNALVVRDIFDVFSAHCTDMAKYNALALPILDALKWYNYVEKTNFEDGSLATESVQKALEKAYGKDAQKYIKNFLRDLNGVREGGRNDGLFNKMLSNYKIAAVAANLRVGLLQITSMPRAAYAIDPKYLAIGVARNAAFQNSRRAEANVGICLWKSLGFYDTNISRNVREMVKHDQSVGGKVKEKSMILAEKGDAWTMGVLYGAVEAEMAAKHPGVSKGSKAYSEMVNARVREIVYQTQVVDSTMTRSDIMRDTGAKSSLATAFMSEPTLTMNMLADSVFEQRMKARESGKKLIAPSKKMVRAFAVNAVVLAFSSVMEAAFTAWRDDDEYETYAEKFDDSFLDTLLENMNPANNLPFVKDVAEALQGRSTARMDNTWAYTLGQGVTEVYKYLTGQSKNPAYNGIYKTLNGLSQMSGFAVGGLTREVVSLYNNLIATPMGYTRIQTYNDSASDAADAILSAYAAGDDSLVERYTDIAAKHGIEGDKLENAIKSAAGEALVAGELDADEVRAVLKEYAGKSDGDVDKLLLKWGYKVQTGLEYSDMKDDYIAGNIDRATALEYYGEDKVSQWDYEKETGSSYSDMREEYVSGRMTASQAREYLMAYGGKTEAKADEQIDRWDYYAATGESDNYTKYWRMYYAFENGGDFRKYAQEWIDAGVKKSNIAASIAGRYKEEYLAIKGTAAGDAMLERLLDLYEAIGYNRAYERKYINDKWKLD